MHGSPLLASRGGQRVAHHFHPHGQEAGPARGAAERPSPRDARGDPGGSRLYADLFPQLAEINRRLMMGLDESDSLLLEEFLRKLTERARQIHDEGDGIDARADRRRGGSRRVWNRA